MQIEREMTAVNGEIIVECELQLSALPRRSSAAVIGEQRTGSDDLGKQKLYKEKQSGSASVRTIISKRDSCHRDQ
jgi:hypothetical protein